MEKKTVKKAVKKSVKKAATKKVAVKKSAPKKAVKEKEEISVEEDDFHFFSFNIPRSVYIGMSWTYFKLYIKSFFKK